jgi:hypothetical protein
MMNMSKRCADTIFLVSAVSFILHLLLKYTEQGYAMRLIFFLKSINFLTLAHVSIHFICKLNLEPCYLRYRAKRLQHRR